MLYHAFLFINICIGLGGTNPLNDGGFQYDFPFISREEWNAREPSAITHLDTPVPFVIIHHSFEPEACYNTLSCKKAMKSMQNYHQIDHGWVDIGYNFAVGSDGAVYEGRGWKAVGAHASGSNSRSIGIVLIGDWIKELPPQKQLATAQKLIAYGVKLGYIHADYKLVGHRQVRPTDCPGDRLYKEISSWYNFDGDYENIHTRVN